MTHDQTTLDPDLLLDTALENTPTVIAFFDRDLRYLKTNSALARFTEKPVSELLGQRLRDVTPLLADSCEEALRQVLVGGSQSRLEFLGQRGRVWQASFFPLNDRAGRPAGVGLRLQEITERKQIEEDLSLATLEHARQVHFFNTALSTIKDYVYAFDRDGRFLFANQTLLDLWNLTKEESLGKTMSDLAYPKEVEATLLEGVRGVFDTKQVVTNETFYTNPAGKSGYYENILSPVFADDGTVAFVVGSSRNVTAAKEAAARDQYLAAVLEHVSDAIISTDPEFRIRSWNKGAEQLYGWRGEEVIGQVFSEVVHTDYVNGERETALEQLTSVGYWKGEVVQHYKDGRPLHVLNSTILVRDEAGRVSGAVATNRDISERKTAEERLKRVAEVTSRFAATQTLAEVGRVILEDVLRALGANGGALRLVVVGGWSSKNTCAALMPARKPSVTTATSRSQPSTRPPMSPAVARHCSLGIPTRFSSTTPLLLLS
jgi:PAS domain S-box-containing protein